MFKVLRNSVRKFLLTGAIAVVISAAAASAGANSLTPIPNSSLVLSCGSSAGNYIIDTATGDYLHGGVWQFIADMMC